MGSEREEHAGFILAADDPRVLWPSLPAPRAPPPRTRDPACPVPSPAGGPEIRGRRPTGRGLLGCQEGHWMATAVAGRRPLMRFGASLATALLSCSHRQLWRTGPFAQQETRDRAT